MKQKITQGKIKKIKMWLDWINGEISPLRVMEALCLLFCDILQEQFNLEIQDDKYIVTEVAKIIEKMAIQKQKISAKEVYRISARVAKNMQENGFAVQHVSNQENQGIDKFLQKKRLFSNTCG